MRNSLSNQSGRILIGQILIVLAAIGLILVVSLDLSAIPFRLRSFIHANSAVWMLTSGLLMFSGLRLLWGSAHERTIWQPSVPGQRFRSVIVYARPDCPLCEEAMEQIEAYRKWIPAPIEVDITDVPELMDKYDDTIPVVEIDGRIRFRGHVNEVLLQRLIEGTQSLPTLRQR